MGRMKLHHAIDIARGISMERLITAQEAVAVAVLMQLAERVMSAKKPLRDLARAVSGEEELNQGSLPGTNG